MERDLLREARSPGVADERAHVLNRVAHDGGLRRGRRLQVLGLVRQDRSMRFLAVSAMPFSVASSPPRTIA